MNFSQELFLDVGCHLLADSTGSMIGSGMIWVPIIIIPIGPVLSLFWILERVYVFIYLLYQWVNQQNFIFLMVVIGTLRISMFTVGTATYALVIIGIVGVLSYFRKL